MDGVGGVADVVKNYKFQTERVDDVCVDFWYRLALMSTLWVVQYVYIVSLQLCRIVHVRHTDRIRPHQICV